MAKLPVTLPRDLQLKELADAYASAIQSRKVVERAYKAYIHDAGVRQKAYQEATDRVTEAKDALLAVARGQTEPFPDEPQVWDE
jgi:hypothetical protein